MENVSMTSPAPPFASASATITTIVSHAATTGMPASTTGVATPMETTTAMSEQTLMYIVIPASVIVGVPLLITAIVAFVSCMCSICKRRKRGTGCCCCCEASATSDADGELHKWPSDGGDKPRKVNSIVPTRPLRDDRRQAEAPSAAKKPRRQQTVDSGAAVGAAASGTAARRNSLTQGWDF